MREHTVCTNASLLRQVDMAMTRYEARGWKFPADHVPTHLRSLPNDTFHHIMPWRRVSFESQNEQKSFRAISHPLDRVQIKYATHQRPESISCSSFLQQHKADELMEDCTEAVAQ